MKLSLLDLKQKTSKNKKQLLFLLSLLYHRGSFWMLNIMCYQLMVHYITVSFCLLIIQRYEHAGVHKWMWELGQYQTPTYCELVQTAQQGSVGQQMKEVKTARIRGQNSGTYVCEMRKNKLLRSQFAGMQKLPHLYSYEIWGQQLSTTSFSWWRKGETFLFLHLFFFFQHDSETCRVNCSALSLKLWK